MDSRLLHKSTAFLKGKVKWDGDSHSQWKSIGQGLERDFKVIVNVIFEHFGEQDLYLVRARTNSEKVLTSELMSKIKSIVGVEDFMLWSPDMTMAIEFNKIGVLRTGIIP